MRRGERVFVFGGVTLALVIAIGGQLSSLPSAAASAVGAAQPEQASAAQSGLKIATCDIYLIADRMLESDRFQPRMLERQEQLRAELAPLEAEVRAMQERGMGLNPESPEAQTLFVEFQQKQQQYAQKAQQLQLSYQQFLARLYVEAYEAARASAEAVADELKYEYVVASRRKGESIDSGDVAQVIQAVLARPMLKSPEGVDITEDVLKDLKL